MGVFSLIYTPSIKVSVMSDEHLKPILVGALYINGKGTLWHLFKDDLSQIMLIIVLVSSWIINELGQILASFCKK